MADMDLENGARLEGPENITPDGTKSTTAPEPEAEHGKFKCPICQASFQSKRQYYSHAFDDHKIGSGVSTAIY